MMGWYPCTFMIFKENKIYCMLKEIWCESHDCKEQMI